MNQAQVLSVTLHILLRQVILCRAGHGNSSTQ